MFLEPQTMLDHSFGSTLRRTRDNTKQQLTNFASTHGYPIKIVRVENDSFFLGRELFDILSEANIEVQLSSPCSR